MARRHLPAAPAADRSARPSPAARPADVAARPDRAGFVLYVGLNGEDGAAAGQAADLAEVAEALRDLARDLLPAAETYTALSLVPGTGSDDVHDLRDRLAALRPLEEPDQAPVAETA